MKVTAKPTSETAVSMTVHERSVSRSVRPPRRETTQNHESFIHEHVIEPQPMTRKM